MTALVRRGSALPPLQGRDGQLHLGDLPLSIETDAMSDPDRVLADTDAAGLGSRVISAPPFAFPVVDAVGVDDYVGRFNDTLARMCRDGGGRLLGLGLVSLHDGAALDLLRAHADPSRLMCGSDYPFDMGVARPLDLPRSVGIGDVTLERNALRFLGL